MRGILLLSLDNRGHLGGKYSDLRKDLLELLFRF